MSEYVQALELQIKDNADQASKGLDKLAADLRKIKSAISGGLGLDKAAGEIKSFATDMGNYVQNNKSAMNSLKQLTGVISGLVTQARKLSSVKNILAEVQKQAAGATASVDNAVSGYGRHTRQRRVYVGRHEEQWLRDNGVPVRHAVSAPGHGAHERGYRSYGGRHSAEWLAANGVGSSGEALSSAVSGAAPVIKEMAAKMSEIATSAGKVEIKTESIAAADKTAKELVTDIEKAAAETKAMSEAKIETAGFDEAKRKVEGITEAAKETTAVLAHIAVPNRLKAALADLYTANQINARGYRAGLEEIGHINWKEEYGAHSTSDDYSNREEARAFMLALVKDAMADLATAERDAAAGARDVGSALSEAGSKGSEMEELAKDIEYAVSRSGSIEEMTDRIENMKSALREKLASGKIKDGTEAFFKEVAAIDRLVSKRDELIRKRDEDAAAAAREAEAIRAAEASFASDIASSGPAMTVSRASILMGHFREGWNKLEESVTKAQTWLHGAAESVKKVGSAFFDANGSLLGMLSGMARMARYRIFRSLIREISEGFSTGLTNVREYSKAINGLYAKDMQSLDNSLLKMKNSLGAAVAPAIQALIPLFQRLTSWVIEASNYVNQFFALINGAKTWTRAVDVQADALEDVDKAASGAAKSTKNLLASWDELNIIQSKSGGGAGGLSKEDTENYETMFEEVTEFDGKVRGLVEYLKENLPLVENLLTIIGGKLLGLTLPASITLSGIIWSFESGRESGIAGKSLIESLKDNIPTMLETALGGAALGFSLMPPGAKLKGAVVGFFLGAALSIFANILGWQQGDNETIFDGKLFGKNMQETVKTVLSFGVLGAAVGFAFAGFKGALAGFTIGSVVGLYLAGVNAEKTPASSVDFDSASVGSILGNDIDKVLMFAGAGLIFGARVGGLWGAGIGLALGIVAYLFLNGIIADKAKEARKREYAEQVEKIRQEFQGYVNANTFSIDITAYVNMIDARINDSKTAHDALQEKLTMFKGKWQIPLGVKAAELTATDLENLNTDVEGLVSAIEDYLEKQNNVIQLSIGLFGDNMDADEVAGLTTLSDAITREGRTIREIGNTIGRILSRGTIEGYEDVVDGMLDVLQRSARIQLAASTSADFNTAVINAASTAKAETDPLQAVVAYQQAYMSAIDQARTSTRLIVEEEYKEAKKAQAQYQDWSMLTDEQLESYGVTMTHDEVVATLGELDALVDRYENDRESMIEERLAEITRAGDEIYQRQLYDLFKDVEGIYAANGSISVVGILKTMTDAGIDVDLDTAKFLKEQIEAGMRLAGGTPVFGGRGAVGDVYGALGAAGFTYAGADSPIEDRKEVFRGMVPNDGYNILIYDPVGTLLYRGTEPPTEAMLRSWANDYGVSYNTPETEPYVGYVNQFTDQLYGEGGEEYNMFRNSGYNVGGYGFVPIEGFDELSDDMKRKIFTLANFSLDTPGNMGSISDEAKDYVTQVLFGETLEELEAEITQKVGGLRRLPEYTVEPSPEDEGIEEDIGGEDTGTAAPVIDVDIDLDENQYPDLANDLDAIMRLLDPEFANEDRAQQISDAIGAWGSMLGGTFNGFTTFDGMDHMLFMTPDGIVAVPMNEDSLDTNAAMAYRLGLGSIEDYHPQYFDADEQFVRKTSGVWITTQGTSEVPYGEDAMNAMARMLMAVSAWENTYGLQRSGVYQDAQGAYYMGFDRWDEEAGEMKSLYVELTKDTINPLTVLAKEFGETADTLGGIGADFAADIYTSDMGNLYEEYGIDTEHGLMMVNFDATKVPTLDIESVGLGDETISPDGLTFEDDTAGREASGGVPYGYVSGAANQNVGFSGTNYGIVNVGYGTSGVPQAEGEEDSGEDNTERDNMMRQMLAVIQRIENKKLTVNVTPSPAWGEHNAKSNDMYERTRG